MSSNGIGGGGRYGLYEGDSGEKVEIERDGEDCVSGLSVRSD